MTTASLTTPSPTTEPHRGGKRRTLHVLVRADIELADQTGLSIPALCGAWIVPDVYYRASGIDGARPGGTRLCSTCMDRYGAIPA